MSVWGNVLNLFLLEPLVQKNVIMGERFISTANYFQDTRLHVQIKGDLWITKYYRDNIWLQ